MTSISWTEQNPHMIITASHDASLAAWRYSKSKQKIERKNIFVIKKNYGCIRAIRVEMEKFLLVAFDTNIFVIFEFPFSPTKSDLVSKIELAPKRVFKNSFEIPFTAASALRSLLQN